MFTGIVEEIGTVQRIVRRGTGAQMRIRCRAVVEDLAVGDSVCVSGACLTATAVDSAGFECDLSAETLARTTLGALRTGSAVNLERAVKAGERLGGHYVNGHVDCVGTVRAFVRKGEGAEAEIVLPREALKYVVEKGSVAVDGVSLTPFDVREQTFRVALIPETLARTTLGRLRPGDKVNVELDVLAKYAERFAGEREAEQGGGLTWEKLVDSGFA